MVKERPEEKRPEEKHSTVVVTFALKGVIPERRSQATAKSFHNIAAQYDTRTLAILTFSRCNSLAVAVLRNRSSTEVSATTGKQTPSCIPNPQKCCHRDARAGTNA